MSAFRSMAVIASAWGCASAMLTGVALAERLPVRNYTTAEGLAGAYIISIDRDSRGFLWFSTRDGLSRFDGVRFTNYGIADGLPTLTINGLLETRAGVYWVATNGSGVFRFNPRGRRPSASELASAEQGQPHRAGDQLFTRLAVGNEPATNRVNVLYEDRKGLVWIGTDDGLFQLESGERAEARPFAIPLPADTRRRGITTMVEDGEGNLWVGGPAGLIRLLPDGRPVVYTLHSDPTGDIVDALFPDEQRLWVGFRSGGGDVAVLRPLPAARFAHMTAPFNHTPERSRTSALAEPGGDRESVHWYGTADGFELATANAIMRGPKDRIWIGGRGGLAEFDGHRFRMYKASNGIPEGYVTALASDTAGNVWIGSVTGATRVIRNGLVTLDESDGVRKRQVFALEIDDAGNVVIIGDDFDLTRFDGQRFESVRPQIPSDARCDWMSTCGLLDRLGQWWVLTSTSLYRLPPVTTLAELAHRLPTAVYGPNRELPGESAFTAFEDSSRRVWIGLSPHGIAQWQQSAGTWRVYGADEGLSSERSPNAPSAFAEDAIGNLWVGFADGGLARLRNGRFQMFGPADGAPAGFITSLHVDSARRLWIGGSQSGLTRVDDPSAERPVFVASAAISGLNVRCITEDLAGRIYAGTSRGVYRLDLKSSALEHFGVGEGLASDFVTAAARDKLGALWFGTMSGMSRLQPEEAAPEAASMPISPVLISGIRVRGVPYAISELGESEPTALTLSPDQNQLEIDFFALAFRASESVTYQHRIDEADADWALPSDLRSLNYAQLAPGSYRLLVRSVGSDGSVSPQPAVVRFTILPPIYARWWFVTLVALLVAGVGVVVYRARVDQLLRVERIRARIATDLHDDIGASLSQMAILAEVAQQRREGTNPEVGASLARIAETSRSLVDSMSDIVWAVNPEADSLGDLVHRMRRFAEDTLSASDIELTFRAPDSDDDLRLGADVRREVYLILKESVTNIAKHSRATRVTIDFMRDRHHLRLRIVDNGRGFDVSAKTEGNGLASMRRRMAALGGTLTIESTPGRGTQISVDLLPQ